MNILIFGSSGQLGSDIFKELSFTKLYNIYRPTSSEINLSKKDFIKKINTKKYDYIINCAAIHDVDFAQKNTELTYHVNSYVPEELAKYCDLNNCHLIHFSTDYVFDGIRSNNLEYIEEDLTNPINIYGASKELGEKKIKSLLKNYYIFRVSTLFGSTPPRGKKYNFVDAIINKFKNNESLSVVSDQFSKPTSTLFISRIVKEMIQNKIESGLYHLTNNQSLSFYDYASKILRFLTSNYVIQKINYNDLKFKVERPKFSSLNSNKIYTYSKINNDLEFYLKDYIKKKYV